MHHFTLSQNTYISKLPQALNNTETWHSLDVLIPIHNMMQKYAAKMINTLPKSTLGSWNNCEG